jgi:signal transduction histidine kinase
MNAPRLRLVLGIVGIVWGIASEAVYYGNGVPALDVLRDLAVGWIYLFGGLAIWSSRPGNPIGRLMTFVGLTWFIGNLQLSDLGPLYVVGTAFADVVAVGLIALILAYPRGSLETRADRVTVAILAIGLTANDAVRLLPLPPGVDLEAPRLYIGLGLAILGYAMVLRRWIVAPSRRRAELLPVLFGGSVLMAILLVSLGIQAFPVPPVVQEFLLAARGLAPAAIPLALLVGFYRQSELRQRALLEAMPDLMIRFARDGHYLDVRDEHSPLLRQSVLPSSGASIEELVPSEMVKMLVEAGAAAIESGRMQTLDFAVDLPVGRRDFEVRITPSGADEVTAIFRDFSEQRAAQADLRQSRARIVEATDAERRHLERDLHDGAQQRLVSLSLALRLARTRLGNDADPDVMASLDAAGEELKKAIVELRELARGIHPAILTEAGLGPAIDSLAARSSVPAAVIALPDRRHSAGVEATAYFVVAEALTNIAKYASATNATVAAESPGPTLRIEIADDGVGGADPSLGTGLRGLADRVAALGGSLSIESPAGGGTRVIATIPTADPAPA